MSPSILLVSRAARPGAAAAAPRRAAARPALPRPPRVLRRATPTAVLLAGLLHAGCTEDDGGGGQAPTDVAAEAAPLGSLGGRALASSTTLRVSWVAAAEVDHLRLRAVDPDGALAAELDVAAATTEAELPGLASSTTYRVTVTACADPACATAAESAPVSATTAVEVWQFVGEGASVSGLQQVVADGNARLSVTRFGPEAGGVTADRLQLYYGPAAGAGGQALAVASTASPTTAAQPASYLAFTSLAGGTGIAVGTGVSAPLVSALGTGTGVPLAASLGARVRLVFEARGADGRNRVLALDSHDGYAGRDFHPGAATRCETTADFAAGGPCEPQVLIAVEGDPDGNPGLREVRQMKLGWPTRDDWRWDGAAGRFMVVTTDAVTGCSTAGFNQAYALWDGERWVVQYGADGCPRLLRSAQAAVPVHLGGGRYKLYYGDPSIDDARLPGSMLPFTGPKTVLYADAARTGDPEVIEFDDWDAQADGRTVEFAWPDGSELDDRAEGYIDDFHPLLPTNDPALQVFYAVITEGTRLPTTAAAVLRNP